MIQRHFGRIALAIASLSLANTASADIWSGICSCHYDSPAFSCSFDRPISGTSREDLNKKCLPDTNGHGTVHQVTRGPAPPPLVEVDFCASINSRPQNGY